MISTVSMFLTSPTKLRETDASIRKVRQNKSPREFSAKNPKSNQINLFPIHRSNPNNCAPDTLVIDKSTFTRVGDAKPKVVGNHWRSHNMRYQLQFRFLVSELDYLSSINTHAILTKCFCLLEEISQIFINCAKISKLLPAQFLNIEDSSIRAAIDFRQRSFFQRPHLSY